MIPVPFYGFARYFVYNVWGMIWDDYHKKKSEYWKIVNIEKLKKQKCKSLKIKQTKTRHIFLKSTPNEDWPIVASKFFSRGTFAYRILAARLLTAGFLPAEPLPAGLLPTMTNILIQRAHVFNFFVRSFLMNFNVAFTVVTPCILGWWLNFG